jgi:hypothetical protein
MAVCVSDMTGVMSLLPYRPISGIVFAMKGIGTMNCLMRWHQTLPACGRNGVDPEL